jgi:DNA repair exonuclease SbcCD ATPase subunit
LEESKDAASEGSNENNFDVVQSPLLRRSTIQAPSTQKERQKTLVPQE